MTRSDWLDSSNKPAFDKITDYIKKAKDAGGEILIGGSGEFRPPDSIYAKLDYVVRRR